MTEQILPEIGISASLRREIDALAMTCASVEDAESVALAHDISAPLHTNPEWVIFDSAVTARILERGYVVVRGLSVDGGRSLLIVSTVLGPAFDTYIPGKIVKRFRMSPWTEELSHTIREGEFHTDANVAIIPPIATAIQCEVEDPGAPADGEQRVAYLPDLLEQLASVPDWAPGLSLLTQPESSMAHERSNGTWRGALVDKGQIRYHPHSLRVASRRLSGQEPDLEVAIAAIHEASLDASIPFHTQPGDALLVSNRTALHYRGECSVRFTEFPMEYESRSVLVINMHERAK